MTNSLTELIVKRRKELNEAKSRLMNDLHIMNLIPLGHNSYEEIKKKVQADSEKLYRLLNYYN